MARKYGTAILRFRFDDPKWVNRASLKVRNVPISWRIKYYDRKRKAMVPLRDAKRNEISGSLWGSAKQWRHTIEREEEVGIKPHAYIPLSFTFPRIHTHRIEIHIDRKPHLSGLAKWKRVAVRHVEFGYNVVDYDDVPPTFDEDVTIHGPLGHVERLVLDDWDASKALDASTSTYWRSTPQPVGDAIVPFYMDVRTPEGEAQLVDRLELNPTTPGPSMNIYYSNDDATSDHMLLARKRITMSNVGDPAIEQYGAKFYVDGHALWVDHDNIRMDLSQSWVAGLTYRPDYGKTVSSTTNRTLSVVYRLDGTDVRLDFDPNTDTFKIIENDGAVDTLQVEVNPPDWVQHDTLVLLWGRSHESDDENWHLFVGVPGGDSVYNTAPIESTDVSLNSVYFGAHSDGSSNARGHIADVWIRQEPFSNRVASAYKDNRDDMMRMIGPEDRVRGDWNAILLARLTRNRMARMGPGSQMFENKTWTPIYRDFQLSRGVLTLPPTKCKYIKLEFSELIPEPYPVWKEGVRRVIKRYPQWVHQWYGVVQQYQSTHVRQWRERVQRAVLEQSPTKFRYIHAGIRHGPSWKEGGRLVTMDPADWLRRAALRGSYGEAITVDGKLFFAHPGWGSIVDITRSSDTYGYFYSIRDKRFDLGHTSTWKDEIEVPETVKKKFFRTIKHQYEERTVEVIAQQAYFVGLHDVKVMRVDYRAQEDTPEYIETFGDTDIVETNELTVDPGTDRAYATAPGQIFETQVLESFSDVEAVQFAYSGHHWESQFDDRQMSFAYPVDDNLLGAVESNLDSGIGSWAGDINCDVAQSANARTGDGALQQIFTGPDLSVMMRASTPTDANAITVEAGHHYVASGWATPDPHNQEGPFDIRLRVEFFDGTSTSVGVVEGDPKPMVAGGWANVQVEAEAPAGAERAAIQPITVDRTAGVDDSPDLGITHWDDFAFGPRAEPYTSHINSINSTWVDVADHITGEGAGGVLQATRVQIRNEIQEVYNDSTTGTFTLEFRDQITAPIAYNAAPSTIETELEALSTIGNVAVSGTGVAGDPWSIEFRDPGNEDVQLLIAEDSGMDGISTITETQKGAGEYGLQTKRGIYTAITGQNEIQELYNNSTTGTFTITFDGQTTAAIAYNASAATVETELEALSNIVNVTVSGVGTQADPWVIEFLDPGAQDVPEITTDDTNMDGTSTVTTVQEGRQANTYDADDPYDSEDSYDGYKLFFSDRVRTSAVVRLFLPETANGTYELRLRANGEIVAYERHTLPARKWVELDMPYLANIADSDYQVEIVQTDLSVEEPFAVDFLAIFQNPLRWDFSVDGGTTWKTAILAPNNPSAFISFPEPGNQLKVRCYAQRETAHVQGFTVVPWYVESPLMSKIPIDYPVPWGQNELEEKRAAKHKPYFKVWDRLFPQRYSLDQQGTVPTTGRGIRL